jgi:hypothetical protein
MSTRRQRAASRANGQKSQGPITEAGKAKSRFNALKHGIDAKQQIMFTESAEDLAVLAAEYHELHRPANADERFLVDTLINNEWRLRRLRCVETELWRAAGQQFMDAHQVEAANSGDAFTGSGPAFERLQRIMNSCERHYRNARKDLQEAQASRAQPQVAQEKIASQPEAAKTTSESPGSIRTSPESAAATAPKLPPNPPDASVDAPLERNMAAKAVPYPAGGDLR